MPAVAAVARIAEAFVPLEVLRAIGLRRKAQQQGLTYRKSLDLHGFWVLGLMLWTSVGLKAAGLKVYIVYTRIDSGF